MKTKTIFSMILLLLIGCSRSNDDLYKEAKTADAQKNYPTALELYSQVVDKAPESAYAESSQYRIAIIYNNELRQIDKAAQAYRKFNTLFPNSPNASTCLFLAGFLYNNDLKKHDSAKVIYEEFMSRYPNHELVKSAQFELSTMGQDPSMLLKQDSAAQPSASASRQGKNQ